MTPAEQVRFVMAVVAVVLGLGLFAAWLLTKAAAARITDDPAEHVYPDDLVPRRYVQRYEELVTFAGFAVLVFTSIGAWA